MTATTRKVLAWMIQFAIQTTITWTYRSIAEFHLLPSEIFHIPETIYPKTTPKYSCYAWKRGMGFAKAEVRPVTNIVHIDLSMIGRTVSW